MKQLYTLTESTIKNESHFNQSTALKFHMEWNNFLSELLLWTKENEAIQFQIIRIKIQVECINGRYFLSVSSEK